jgi:hypothetical protein
VAGRPAISTFVLVSAASSLAVAGANPPVSIDEANATIQVPSSNFTASQCAGVYAVGYVNNPANYVTYTGTWKGSETEGVGPLGLTDYNLTGKWTVKKVDWTINLTTDRGVLTGDIVFQSVPPNGGPKAVTYEGPLTLITQGLPNTAGAAVPARGWIDASTYTNGSPDGGSLLANAEFVISPGFAATGQFGDANASLNIPDYSVITTNQVC